MGKKVEFSFSMSCLRVLGRYGSLASRAEAASLVPMSLSFCTEKEMVPKRHSEIK